MKIVRYTLDVLPYISGFSTLVPFIFALVCLKKLTVELRLILYLVVASLLTEIVSTIVPILTNSSNIVFINFYFIVETVLVTLFYVKITASSSWKYIMYFLCFLSCSWSMFYMFGKNKDSMNIVAVAIESVSVIIYTLLTYYYFIKNMEHSNIFGVPVFWINTAFLLFFGGNLFLHVFSNYLLEHSLYAFFKLWGLIHSSLNICFYLLISVGFWKTRKFQI